MGPKPASEIDAYVRDVRSSCHQPACANDFSQHYRRMCISYYDLQAQSLTMHNFHNYGVASDEDPAFIKSWMEQSDHDSEFGEDLSVHTGCS